jgi:hypothetical protein
MVGVNQDWPLGEKLVNAGALLGSRSFPGLHEEPSAACPDGAHLRTGAEEDLEAKLVERGAGELHDVGRRHGAPQRLQRGGQRPSATSTKRVSRSIAKPPTGSTRSPDPDSNDVAVTFHPSNPRISVRIGARCAIRWPPSSSGTRGVAWARGIEDAAPSPARLVLRFAYGCSTKSLGLSCNDVIAPTPAAPANAAART